MKTNIFHEGGIYGVSIQGGDFGIHTEGKTFEDLMNNLKEAINLHNENCLNHQKISIKDIIFHFNVENILNASYA